MSDTPVCTHVTQDGIAATSNFVALPHCCPDSVLQDAPQGPFSLTADSATHGYLPADGLSGAVVGICIGRLPGQCFHSGRAELRPVGSLLAVGGDFG